MQFAGKNVKLVLNFRGLHLDPISTKIRPLETRTDGCLLTCKSPRVLGSSLLGEMGCTLSVRFLPSSECREKLDWRPLGISRWIL